MRYEFPPLLLKRLFDMAEVRAHITPAYPTNQTRGRFFVSIAGEDDVSMKVIFEDSIPQGAVFSMKWKVFPVTQEMISRCVPVTPDLNAMIWKGEWIKLDAPPDGLHE